MCVQVKLISVAIDGRPLLSDDVGVAKEGPEERLFLLRRAPGHVQYDFAQDVLFQTGQEAQAEPPSYLPRGCILVINLINSFF